MDSNVQYEKVSVNDAAVVALAAKLGVTPKSVAAMLNAERYRKAYNRLKQQRDKQMKEFFKQHPELLPKEVK